MSNIFKFNLGDKVNYLNQTWKIIDRVIVDFDIKYQLENDKKNTIYVDEELLKGE